MSQCTRPACFAPETSCDLGYLDRLKCPSWKNVDSGAANSTGGSDDLLLPWSGSVLGLADLAFISGREKPLIVGIIGPRNAGKTTLLAAWYLLLGNGLINSPIRQFSGSYSLPGWEAVAGRLRWSPGDRPSFPPHTSSRTGRAPGLLHLAFRKLSGRTKDYLFTDAPGEWFEKWGVNRDGPQAEGVRWIAEHADVFLLIADREALSGPKMGSARGTLQILAHRLSDERQGRPVALVWTKQDIDVAEETEKVVRDTVSSRMPDAAEFSVSVVSNDGQGNASGFLKLFDWVLSARRCQPTLPPLNADKADPLFMLGTRTP